MSSTGPSGSTEPRVAGGERLFSLLLAGSILAWAIGGLLGEPMSLPRLALACLQVVVALQVARRRAIRRAGAWWMCPASVPSLLVSGVALSLAPPARAWPIAIQVVFAIGAALAVVSFFALARSCAILPAVRDVVVRGPYRWVRHPAYAGEMVMVAACLLAISPPCLLALPAVVVLVVPRILAEEALLDVEPEYARYTTRVRFRLVPGLW